MTTPILSDDLADPSTMPARSAEADRTLLRAVLARPVVSVLAVLALVAVVFVLLLQAGPPTEWF